METFKGDSDGTRLGDDIASTAEGREANKQWEFQRWYADLKEQLKRRRASG